MSILILLVTIFGHNVITSLGNDHMLPIGNAIGILMYFIKYIKYIKLTNTCFYSPSLGIILFFISNKNFVENYHSKFYDYTNQYGVIIW